MSEEVLDAPVETPEAAPAVAEPTSLLASTEAMPATEEAQGFNIDAVPEAFRVLNGEELDYRATTEKLAEAYQARAAYGDIPEEYSEVPDMAAPWEEIKELPAVKAFAEEAKKLGMTDAQFSFALKNISAAERDGRTFALQQGREEAEGALRNVWAEPEEFSLNLRQANHAMQVLVPEADRDTFGNRYGNDPMVIQLLAKIGGELSEDQAYGILQPVPTSEDVESLMKSEAYRDSEHAEHKSVMAKVERYYQKKYGTQVAL